MNSRKPSWQEILTKIKNCFPEALTEKERIGEDGKPYIVHALKQEFLDEIKGLVDISDDSDRYELRFPGKRRARLQAQIPSYKTLIPKDGVDTGFNETGNLFIEGDNLDVLRMLRKSYRERIKMIYIDPPYNTGNDDFIYQDDFSQTQQEYLKDIGVLDEEGVQQISELKDGLRGRFHAGWLAMMYPRLKLARELLTDDGVIFISIDDNEQANLKLICDEIFGEGNFVGDIIWHSTKSVTNTALISSSYTHNLAYMKNKQYYVEHRYLFRLLESGQGFSNSDNDPRGPWKADPFQVDGWRPNQQYEIINPNTGKIYKPLPGKSWKNEDGKFKKLLEDNRIVFGKSGVSGPQRKRFLHEAEKRGRVSINLWSDLPTNTNATNDFISLMGGNYFSNPKPEKLIERFATLCTRNNDIVLDFFAGSATTAHAVMQLNAEDGGKRRFIMVQRPESIDPKKSKETYDFCIKNLPPPPPRQKFRGVRALQRLFRLLPTLRVSASDAPEKKSTMSIRKRKSISVFDLFAWWIRFFLEIPRRVWPIPAKGSCLPIIRI